MTRISFTLMACAALFMIESCRAPNIYLPLADAKYKGIFRATGRILVGDPPRAAANVEVRLVDLAPERLSPGGPTDPYEFAGAQTRTSSSGRFAIQVEHSERLQRALKRGALGLSVIGHGEGAGLIQLKSGVNPDYVLPSTRVTR